jgi:hypothetical protein
LIVDLGVERVISADRPEWVPVFTGLSVRQFGKLVSIVAGRGGERTGTGRRWGRSWLIGVCSWRCRNDCRAYRDSGVDQQCQGAVRLKNPSPQVRLRGGTP